MSSREIRTTVMVITLAQAATWIKNTGHQRPLNRQHVDFLANEIAEGRFVCNGEPIVIAADGSVLNGQHRLHGVLKAKKSIESVVVFNVATEHFGTIDQGMTRSKADALFIEGMSSVPMSSRAAIASAVSMAIMTDENGCLLASKDGMRRVSNTHVLQYIRNNQRVVDEAQQLFRLKTASPVPIAHLIYLFHLVGQNFPTCFADFFQPLITGGNISDGSTSLVLRNLATQRPRPEHYGTQRNQIALLVKTWNSHVTGKSLRLLRYSASHEPFPSILTTPVS